MAKTKEEVREERFLELEREELHRLLRLMLLSRRFEEKTAEAYQMGRIGGFCHLYIGQEAVAAGAISALRDDDYVLTAYRDHAQALVRGVSARAVMAELYGRIDGCSRGAGGSMHMFDRSVNFLGGHGIVGTHLPLAAGVGYAIRYRQADQVCLCFFGDSVVNGGPFHEAFNMVAKWELPVVYIVENNSFGMGTDIDRVAAIDDLFTRACAYQGKKAEQVDGQDVIAVREAVERAVARARDEKRPTFIEARTYRYLGHSMSDPAHGVYRTREEVAAERERDPINTFVERLKEADLITEDEVEAMDAEVIDEVEDAAEFAEASDVPGPEEIYAHSYSDGFRGGPDRRDTWR
ncbi:MAG: pyruvate dehydrogenase (acetyl-transferring) E1 component subunit alpha [Gemmatimonadota bacterium]|nr:pyruvate dehydrogenase (acetyl-transferring) E1 component subunit alpha [Gemmatimonadota bacterium]